MRKFLIIILSIGILLTTVSCNNKENSVGTPVITEKPTITPDNTEDNTPKKTPEPTPDNTKEPLVTVEPGTGKYSGGILDENKGTEAMLWQPNYGSEGQKPLENKEGIDIQFFATTTFNSIGVHCPTYEKTEGHIVTFMLFAWAGSYEATQLTEPIATSTFKDWKDGVRLGLDFDPLPDGEYLLSLIPDGELSAAWYYPEAHEGQRVYKAAEVVENAAVRFGIRYTKTPKNLYGPLSDLRY